MTEVLVATGLARTLGEEPAVAGVDLTLRAGEVHALVGLNGAGKTTLMRLLLGMLRPDAGHVTVRLDAARATAAGTDGGIDGRGDDAVDIRDLSSAAWAIVGHLIETPFLYGELTVAQTVRAAARLHGIPRHRAADAAGHAVADLGLTHWADRRTSTLSLGNRQRVGLACALVHGPRLLVLDEPTNALDPAGVLLVRRRLLRATADGAAVLVSSHHLDEMARVADRITVMHRGVVVGALPPGGADLERQFFEMVYATEESLTDGVTS